MAKPTVVIEGIYHAEVSKVNTDDHSFEVTFFGKSTLGNDRKVRVHMKPWLYEYFARELADIPKQIHKIADNMQEALRK